VVTINNIGMEREGVIYTLDCNTPWVMLHLSVIKWSTLSHI